MARKAAGFFKKALNVIGLVDEPVEDERDYDRGYGRGYDRDPYGGGYMNRSANSRPSTYVPPQQRSRTAETRRRTVVPDERGRSYGASSASRTGRAGAYNYDEGYTVRRSNRAYDEPDMEMNRASARRPAQESAPRAPQVNRRSAPMPQNPGAMTRPGGLGNARTVMYSIKSLAECGDVVDTLIANDIVLLMLEDLDTATSQRVVDTLSGAAFALHATIRKASDRTYLIAPRTVEVNDPNYFGTRG